MWWPALAAGLAGLAPFGQPEALNINVM